MLVYEVPTNRPVIRIDNPDAVYGTKKAKFDALADEVSRRHVILQQDVVIAADHLSEQEELRIAVLEMMVKLADEVLVQAIGNVKAQAVNAELGNPLIDALQQVADHIRILQVQLDQLIVAFPVAVGEAVGIAIVSIVDIEPVSIAGIPFSLQHILEAEEAAADMQERTTQAGESITLSCPAGF